MRAFLILLGLAVSVFGATRVAFARYGECQGEYGVITDSSGVILSYEWAGCWGDCPNEGGNSGTCIEASSVSSPGYLTCWCSYPDGTAGMGFNGVPDFYISSIGSTEECDLKFTRDQAGDVTAALCLGDCITGSCTYNTIDHLPLPGGTIWQSRECHCAGP